MDRTARRTLRNGAIGGVAGAALGFVPLVLLVAPLIGGGIAGYLEADGPKRGALAGGAAGVLMAALSTMVRVSSCSSASAVYRSFPPTSHSRGSRSRPHSH